MTTPRHTKLPNDLPYYGQILNGNYTQALKERVADCISRLYTFEESGNPAIPYVSAWQEEEKTMWYEYAGKRFIDLMACEPEAVPAILRKSIIERRVYKYMDIDDSRIKKETLQQQELVGSRAGLRQEGEQKGIVEAVYKIALEGGRVFWLKDQAYVENFDKDKIHISLGCLTIVTKEMEAEEELARAQAALEKYTEELRVAKALADENAAKLAKAIEQVEAAKEEAVRANKAKSEFLAVISHEIRSPMNGIIGTCDLIMDTPLDRKQQEYLKIMRSSARSLLGLINDILDFSKIEAGKLDFEAVPFVLREVIEEVADMFLEAMSKKDIEVVVDIASDVPRELIADPLRLRQVLINLTANALKFTDKGEVCITVQLREASEDVVELLFCVRDTGIGIASRDQRNLFDVFTQVNGSTTRKYQGTGLGLAICKRIVEMMGGNVWVESEPNVGSLFYFTARLQVEHLGVAQGPVVPPEFKTLRALIVEDNPSTLRVMKRFLTSFGFDTSTCESAEAALAFYEQKAISAASKGQEKRPFDLILMDARLPGMDGISAADRIKRAHPNPPRIILSNIVGRKIDGYRTKAAGIDGFLVKPVKEALLLDTILETFGYKAVVSNERESGLIRPDEFLRISVLLVEDNPTNRRIASEILQNAGMQVDVAENGREAVAAVREKSYAAVLMDVQMPQMDGIEATRIIRREISVQKLPIIAMTAHALSGDRGKCIAAGMNDYVIKPIDRKELFASLRKYVRPQVSDIADKPNKEVLVARTMPKTSTVPEKMMPADSPPGLDLTSGLQRIGGAFDVYVDILKDFCADKAQFGSDLRRLVEAKDFKMAKIEAHALKGAAGNVSAPDLAQAARVLESACDSQNRDHVLEVLKPVEACLKVVQDALTQLYQRPGAAFVPDTAKGQGQHPAVLDADLTAVFDNLEVGLIGFDPIKSADYLETLKVRLSQVEFADDLKDLAYHIGQYRFETARGIIAAMRAKLGSQG
jgi:two-component system, sensor histidine kinase and response regulator